MEKEKSPREHIKIKIERSYMNFIPWFSNKKQYVSFESISQPNIHLINTLPHNLQDCLIENTIHSTDEEHIMNAWIENGELEKKIILYGKHNMDDTTETKYDQLQKYGFRNLYIYKGGLFEWLLLQDIYGKENFKTTRVCNDILKYKPYKTVL